MSEISQEAKNALAEISKRKARERLHRDGSDSTPAMQRRIQALAAERSIPAKLLHSLGEQHLSLLAKKGDGPTPAA